MEEMRMMTIIKNLLNEICTKTDITLDQYEDWLVLEAGVTAEEIEYLKNHNSFPTPCS